MQTHCPVQHWLLCLLPNHICKLPATSASRRRSHMLVLIFLSKLHFRTSELRSLLDTVFLWWNWLAHWLLRYWSRTFFSSKSNLLIRPERYVISNQAWKEPAKTHISTHSTNVPVYSFSPIFAETLILRFSHWNRVSNLELYRALPEDRVKKYLCLEVNKHLDKTKYLISFFRIPLITQRRKPAKARLAKSWHALWRFTVDDSYILCSVKFALCNRNYRDNFFCC